MSAVGHRARNLRRQQDHPFTLCEPLESRLLFSVLAVSPTTSPKVAPASAVFAHFDDSEDGSSGDDDGSSSDDGGSDTQPTTEPTTQPSETEPTPPADDSSSNGDNSGDDNSSDDSQSDDNFPEDDYSADYSVGPCIFPPITPLCVTVKALTPFAARIQWLGDSSNTDHFRIYRIDPGPFGWLPIATIDGNHTTFYDISLRPRTRYFYSVLAINSAGSSNLSFPATIVTPDVQRPPTGHVDVLNSGTLAGWTLDLNTPALPVNISLYIDGNLRSATAANNYRADLIKPFESARHDFSIALPTLSIGLHRVDLYATDTTTGAKSLLTSRTLNTNHAPAGYLDVANPQRLAGWAFDPDSGAAPAEVLYAIDNHAPTLAAADVSRPDLVAHVGSAGHGFVIDLPQLSAGSHAVSVFAVDSTTDALTLLGRKKINSASAAAQSLPEGWLDIAGTSLVAGWARDPAAPGNSVYVRIDVDNQPGAAFLADGSRADLQKPFGNSHLGFAEPMSLTPGEHRVTLYLQTTPTAMPVLLASRIVRTRPPRGYLDVLTPSLIAGWAYNSGVSESAARLRVDIDKVPAALTLANSSRPDLMPLLGAANFGFSISMPHVASGHHEVTLLLVDPLTLQLVPLAARSFTAV